VDAVKKLKRERKKSIEKKTVGSSNIVNILYVQNSPSLFLTWV